MNRRAPKRPKAGRPTSLTPEVHEKICWHIREARTIPEACKAVGISTVTFWNWTERGRNGEEPFLAFLNAVEKAKRERVAALADMVVKAGRKDWRAADRMLQVLVPKEYAPRIRVHLEEEFSRAVTRIEAAFAGEPEVLDRVLAALADERGEAGAAPAAGGEDGGGDGGGGGSSEAVPAPQPE